MTRFDPIQKSSIDIDKIKIIFKSTEIPYDIKIYGASFKVKPFMHQQLFCAQCLNYGHTKKYCHNQKICRACTEVHDNYETKCTKIFCKFCKTNAHITNGKNCIEKEKQMLIKTIMIKEKNSFQNAKKVLKELMSNPFSKSNYIKTPSFKKIVDTLAIENQNHNTEKLKEEQLRAQLEEANLIKKDKSI